MLDYFSPQPWWHPSCNRNATIPDNGWTIPVPCHPGGAKITARILADNTRAAPMKPVAFRMISHPLRNQQETAQNLREQVGASTRVTRKRKPENTPAPTLDTKVWLHEARCANDSEAVPWFTRTILHPQPEDLPTQPKRPRLAGARLDSRWTRHRTRMEELVRLHMHAANRTYQYCLQTHHEPHHMTKGHVSTHKQCRSGRKAGVPRTGKLETAQSLVQTTAIGHTTHSTGGCTAGEYEGRN